jgi:NAD(P)H dehydrogenase (quinone)
MRYLIVFAHPEPRSLNGHLLRRGVAALKAAGHEVVVSDLYAMGFKAVADGRDFPERDIGARLVYHAESGAAYAGGSQAPEVAAEQAKLLAADAVVLHFPLWWFGMPAILKGWVDRVFATGFAIGVPKPGTRQWLRYGEGNLAGRRAMIACTTGGRAPQYGARGVHGPIRDILFPINHGMLFYTGMTVIEPFIGYRVVRASTTEADALADAYAARLLGMFDAPPIAYRSENGGAYDEEQRLAPEYGEGEGFSLHEG